MKAPRKWFLLGSTAMMLVGLCAAQDFWGGDRGGGRRGFGRRLSEGPIQFTEGGDAVNEDTVRTARETVTHSTGTPNWTNEPGFQGDVFTFTRIIYDYDKLRVGTMMAWINDYPDSDLNLSWRLQMLTSMKVDPDARTLKLTNADLFNYPFIYMVKPNRMVLRDEEVPILRKYLANGGALMADDFWGDADWEHFEGQIRRVLPKRAWVELPITHPIFHCVFPLDHLGTVTNLQVPSINRWRPNRRNGGRFGYGHGEDARDMHVRAWLDDKQRIMVIATHNTDNGDGWEREGENVEYFQTFSETRAYPLGINIIVYLMTH